MKNNVRTKIEDNQEMLEIELRISQDPTEEKIIRYIKKRTAISYQCMIQLSLNNILKDYPYYVNMT